MLPVLRYPGYFKAVLFQTFFPFSWGLQNSRVQLYKTMPLKQLLHFVLSKPPACIIIQWCLLKHQLISIFLCVCCLFLVLIRVKTWHAIQMLKTHKSFSWKYHLFKWILGYIELKKFGQNLWGTKLCQGFFLSWIFLLWRPWTQIFWYCRFCRFKCSKHLMKGSQTH